MSHKSILLVEDSPDIMILIKKVIVAKGYIVFQADNGKEAMHKLTILGEDHKPCLILCDLQMPIMNGWEFVNNVSKDAKVVAIPLVIHTSEEKGPEGYRLLRKPVDFKLLMEVVEEHCGLPKLPLSPLAVSPAAPLLPL